MFTLLKHDAGSQSLVLVGLLNSSDGKRHHKLPRKACGLCREKKVMKRLCFPLLQRHTPPIVTETRDANLD